MRRCSGLCIVKTIILAFAATTLGLMIFSWVSDPLARYPSKIESKNLHQKAPWQRDVDYEQKNARDVDYEQKNAVVHFKNFGTVKKDWHDVEAMRADMKRTGLGEQGRPAKVPNGDAEKERFLYSQNGFNGYLSDHISLNRSLPDIRYIGCRTKKYLNKLPTVSVVIPFFNEHWSTLLRSVYSVLNRSPPELIKEIVLVDDHSTKEFLKDDLDRYVKQYLPKVKIVRLPERSGLILARLAGARIATAEVLIFLDSHVEANYNWLPPLLEPIAENPRTSVCPFIDVIDHDNFEYRAQDEGARGAFDWQFYYKRLPLLPEDLKDKTKPFRDPVMAGGLFAIGTEFFWELGGYDEGLDIWGGEQYELSFKIWMCGGQLLDAPCSRVGHIYRGSVPFNNPRKKDYLHKNYKRVAEIWMDEYKNYLYARDPDIYARTDTGDISKMLAIRKKLQCKSFDWFMKNIAFDLPKKYPMVEPPHFAQGGIQSLADPRFCLDSLNRKHQEEVGLYSCANNLKNPHGNQYWALSWHKDLRSKDNDDCLDVSKSSRDAPAILYGCHGQQGNQLWYYDAERKFLKHGRNNRCLEAHIKERKVYVNDCDDSNPNMKWNFGIVNKTALAHFYDKEEGTDL